jgi:hypothetical protein
LSAAYLSQALRDAGAVELRHLNGDRIECGLFSDSDLLREEIAKRATVGNLYLTLNRPNVPATNRMGRRGLRDADIARVVRLPFDFDPVRPTGTASTDGEMSAAIVQRDRFVAAQLALGWPMPALAFSGNGGHALYRCLLPNDERTRNALRAIYAGMRAEFSTEEVLFDSTVHNASRIWRLYGTTNRKGTATPERPHRLAEIVIPHRWAAVSPDQVFGLAALYEQRQRRDRVHAPQIDHAVVAGSGDYTTLDAVRWFEAHGAYRRPLGSGKHAVRCPWDAEHSSVDDDRSTATVIWESDGGWPTFHCSHAHCEGRGTRDVMVLWDDADAYCARQFARRAAA